MSQTPSAAPPPSITRNWIRNGALIGAVHFLAGLCLYLLRPTPAAGGEETIEFAVVGYLAVIVVGMLAGAAEGILSGAVLQRILPALPVRTWIALHAVISAGLLVIASPWSEPAREVPQTYDDVPIAGALLVVFIMGAIISAVTAGLEALVLRKAAFGIATWIAYSALAGGVAYSGLLAFTSTWESTNGVNEMTRLMVAFVLTVIQALILLPAIWTLKPRATPQDVF
jgi:hypothetical protein